MEVGAVCGAAPKANVIRKKPEAGDIVVLIGGATGRDGVGGATGSSKEHNDTSLTKCSSEVQKGNAPIERKLQRLFRNPDCTRLIKKANDFGAGGVSVAVGELADGLVIDLDKVPVKYNGLSGTELAIPESQERMACVIEAKDFEAFKQLAYEENLDACIVATVTEEARLVMHFQGKEIVNMSRAFLDTNGVRGVQNVIIKEGLTASNPFKAKFDSVEEMLQMPNVASQIGLSGTELAISESQERMACVIEAKDFEAFKQLAYEEEMGGFKHATRMFEALLLVIKDEYCGGYNLKV